MMNNINLIGRLTQDPDIRYTQAGKEVASFTIAVTRQFKRDETDFINCTAWGKIAELAGSYLKKGHRVGIQGSIRVSSYENENGEKRKSFEVTINNLEFLESKK